MIITKLKAKNQLTIPASIVKRMQLKPNELFSVDIERNYIKLVPVEMEPRYTAEELAGVKAIAHKEIKRAKTFKTKKELCAYARKIAK